MEFASTTHLDKDEESRGDSETDESVYLAHRAAAGGNVTLLMDAVNHDPSVLECQDEKGMTPLSHAVTNQRLDLLKLLVKMGANINTQDSLGRTPLCLAAYECWHEGVVFLLRSGAKQLIPDKHGRLPLHAATCDKDSRSLSALLQNLAVSDINESDNDGMTALHWAAFHNRPEHVQLLMLRGGDIYKTDVDEKTPMHWASQNGSVICCSIMAKCHSGGAPLINALEGSGKNCVHLACAAGNAAILEVFASIPDVEFEALDPDERVPLHWAAVKGNTDCVVYLVQLGVDLSPEDVCGRTPLGYAKQAGMTEIFQFLKENGAQFGKTELLALEKRNSSGKIKDQKNKDGKGNESKKSRFKFLTGWLDKRKNKSKDSENGDKNEEDCEDLFHDACGERTIDVPDEIKDIGTDNSLSVPASGDLQLIQTPGDDKPTSQHPQGSSPIAIHFDSSPRSEGSLSSAGYNASIDDKLSPRSLGGDLSDSNLEDCSPRSIASHHSATSVRSSHSVHSTGQSIQETTLVVPNLKNQRQSESTESSSSHEDKTSPCYRDRRGRTNPNPKAFPRYNPLPDPFSLSRAESNSHVNSDVPMNVIKPVWSSEGPDYEVLERQAREILDAQKEAEEENIVKIQIPEGDFWNRFPYNSGNPKLEPIRGRDKNSTFSSLTVGSSADEILASHTTEDKITSSKQEKGKSTKKRRKQKRKDSDNSALVNARNTSDKLVTNNSKPSHVGTL